MNISVLTLTWNGLDKLKILQPGLIRNLKETNQPWTWYIRSNGCKDGTVGEVEKWEGVKVLVKDHNRDNFAQGVNSLARMTEKVEDDTVYLLMNNDVEFPDNTSLVEMINLMKESDASIVGCRLLYNGTNNLQHAGVIFSKRYGNMPYHYRHKELSDSAAEQNRYFQAVTAAVCLVKAKDFWKVDGMDEKYHWAFEDIDLNLKIGSLNKKIAYCGKTKIYHEESASLAKNPVNKLMMSPNVAHFKSKWSGKYRIDHDQYLQNAAFNLVQ